MDYIIYCTIGFLHHRGGVLVQIISEWTSYGFRGVLLSSWGVILVTQFSRFSGEVSHEPKRDGTKE
jgi:hypothetical protein